MPKDLFSEKLESFSVVIGDVWDWDSAWDKSGKYKISRALKLKLSTSALLERVRVLLMKTEDLCLDDMKGISSVLPELDNQGFPQLKHLHVQNSPDIQYIIDWKITGRSTAFPRLESLFLHNLNKLEKICHGSSVVGSFNNLRKLMVWNCTVLRSLFSFSMFKGLGKVEEVDVKGCTIMEEIVVEEGEDDEKINLPQLRYLRLENLPQFISFCSRVKEATTSGGNKEIECEDETETPMPLFSRKVSFPNLTILIVDGCDNLKNLLSLSSVVHLKRLEICNCKMMEEVMVKEGLEERIMSKMLLHQLESLKLENLPNSRDSAQVAFPNLEQLEILNMDNLKMIWHNELHSDSFCKINALTVEHCEELIKIFPSTLLRGLRNLQRLFIHNCDLLQEVFDLQELIKMKESVAIQLGTLHIEGLPNLKHVWNEDPLGLVLFHYLSSVYVWRCPNLKFIFPASIAKNLLQLKTLDISSSGVEEIVQNLNWVETNMENQPMVKVLQPHFSFRKVSFPNLTILIVDGCDNLKNLLSLSSVVHLKRLEICNCKMMEEVMVKEGLEEEIMSKMLLHQLESLELMDLPKLTRFCTSNLVECPVLKHLRIQNCPQMSTFVSNYTTSNMASSREFGIINSALFDEKVAFPNLEQLEILNMDNLKMIWHNKLHSDSFCKINALTVEHCEELIKIFPSTLLRGLRNLQNLVIHNCDLLQEVFDLQGLIKMKESVAIQLRTLHIYSLPNLKHVWNEDPLGLVLFDNLSSVSVWDCPNLKFIFPASIAKNLPQLKTLDIARSGLEEIVQNLNWVETNMENQPMVSFPNLTLLIVDGCDNLKILLSLSSVVHLERLQIRNCKMMEEVMVKEGLEEEIMSKMLLHQVESLELENLPKLTRFCTSNLVECPVLEELRIKNCPQMRTFVSNYTTSNMASSSELDIINSALFDEKIGFPNLEDIKLSGINVKMIWPNQHIESSLYIEKLTTLIVDGCGNLNYLFTSSIVGSLAQLKTLEICECKSMEEVIIAEGEGEMMSKMLFPKLHSLKLKGLPRIVRFCTANLIECPSLKVLRADNCPHLHAFLSTCISKNVGTSSGVTQANATLFDEKVWFPNLEELYIMHMHKLEMIWCDELLADSFSRLKVLQVQYGKQLLKIFPSKLLGRFLQNLELLVVKNCDSVEEVFDLRALVRVSEAPVVERSQLRTLDIRDLPNLKQVWNMDPHGILSFYNLRLVYAWNCPKLKSLFPFSIALGLPHLELLNINGCHVTLSTL
ncbi:hypothetical protein GH714_024930 [Hevea brasiliensis]|uniref:Disease resistance protein At4g27190-like leucine-rich repeats domain-containing protein n=1 Tax=Hevea brasiliensis TaxID=3981 RepID=A0A6A6M492_HEVBR|nr:hypothetical protein GH714_024930 [Hevea brasiliensis]